MWRDYAVLARPLRVLRVDWGFFAIVLAVTVVPSFAFRDVTPGLFAGLLFYLYGLLYACVVDEVGPDWVRVVGRVLDRDAHWFSYPQASVHRLPDGDAVGLGRDRLRLGMVVRATGYALRSDGRRSSVSGEEAVVSLASFLASSPVGVGISWVVQDGAAWAFFVDGIPAAAVGGPEAAVLARERPAVPDGLHRVDPLSGEIAAYILRCLAFGRDPAGGLHAGVPGGFPGSQAEPTEVMSQPSLERGAAGFRVDGSRSRERWRPSLKPCADGVFVDGRLFGVWSCVEPPGVASAAGRRRLFAALPPAAVLMASWRRWSPEAVAARFAVLDRHHAMLRYSLFENLSAGSAADGSARVDARLADVRAACSEAVEGGSPYGEVALSVAVPGTRTELDAAGRRIGLAFAAVGAQAVRERGRPLAAWSARASLLSGSSPARRLMASSGLAASLFPPVPWVPS